MRKIILIQYLIILAFSLKAQEKPAINSDYFLRPGEDPYDKIRENLFLKLTVNKKNCFVGEPVLATFTLYSRLESRSDIVKNPGFYGFTVYDMISLADKEMVTEYVRGKLFDVHTIRKVQLYPLREGVYPIDAMDVKNTVEFSRSAVNKKTEQEIVEGMLRSDSNEMKDNNAEIFESNVSTEPIAITVKPTPERSKPAIFNGAVGIFKISTSVIKDTLEKNEENVLEITISGRGNLLQLNAPVVEWPEGIEGFEPVVKDMFEKTQSPLSGSRIFRYAFVSAKPGKYIIPSISFSFFNPDSGKYKTITSSAIPVKISYKAITSRQDREVSEKVINNDKGYWLIGSVALLLILASLYFFFVKRKEELNLKSKGTTPIPQALSIDEILHPSLSSELIADKDFYDLLHEAVWKFFSHHFNLSGSEMNKGNLLGKLEEKKLNGKLINATIQILQQCETGKFTNANLINNKDELLQKTRKLFEEINGILSSAGES